MKTYKVSVAARVSVTYWIDAQSEADANATATEWFFDERVSDLVIERREQCVIEDEEQ